MGSTRDKYALVLAYFIDHGRVTVPEVSDATGVHRIAVRQWLRALIGAGLAVEEKPYVLHAGPGRSRRGLNPTTGVQPAVYGWRGF